MGIRGSLACTRSRRTPCAACGRQILRALDEGWPARVDAAPIHDELAHIAAGRRTYTHTPGGALIERTPERLQSAPAGTLHVEHACGVPSA